VTLMRGRVYEAVISENVGKKLYLVVSNNQRNQALGSALVVRLTTSPKPPIPSVVDLPDTEQFSARIVCDDIEDMYESEVINSAGALSPAAMRLVDQGLKAALDLD
jgi:mRNA interferase MazF